MNVRIFPTYSLFFVLIFIELIMGYGILSQEWWSFIPSTLMIVGTTYKFYPQNWKQYLGLCGTPTLWLGGIVIAASVSGVVDGVLGHVMKGFYRFSAITTEDIGTEGVRVFFQCLNEEMVFRGLLLTRALKSSRRPFCLMIIIAGIFCLAHLLFYRFNAVALNRGWLSLGALSSIFIFAMSSNLLFFGFHSIALPLALHFAWNFHRFSSKLVSLARPEERITELESFNLIENSPEVIVLALGVFVISLLFFFLTQDQRK